MKRLETIIICLTLSIAVWAQKEMNNWFFGYGVGLTWNTTRSMQVYGLNTPNVTLTDLPTQISSPLRTEEGCFSVSDEDGNLLFFSDGSTVYDKNHAVMQNGTGLLGHSSSPQSGIVMPYPGQENKYIVATIQEQGTNGLYYSVVDMNLNGGLGAVSTKNISLVGASGMLNESLTAVRHANGKDYWIIAPGRDGDFAFFRPTYLNVWKVTESGVDVNVHHKYAIDDLSLIGIYIGGCIRFATNGKYFAWAVMTNRSEIVYGEFNPGTGTFRTVKYFAPGQSYGIEFSLSGKYMYAASYNSGSVIRVFDFEALLAGTNLTPKTVSIGRMYNGSAQLGPDGRIYVTAPAQPLVIIDNPEDYDDLRVYRANLVSSVNNLRLGLPTFSASWLQIKMEGETEFCNNESQEFTVHLNSTWQTAAYLIWDWKDGTTTKTLVSGSLEICSESHSFTTAGIYDIEVTAYYYDDTYLDNVIRQVEVLQCGSNVLKVNPFIRSYYE